MGDRREGEQIVFLLGSSETRGPSGSELTVVMNSIGRRADKLSMSRQTTNCSSRPP